MVTEGNCSFYERALAAQTAGAGLLVVVANSSDLSDLVSCWGGALALPLQKEKFALLCFAFNVHNRLYHCDVMGGKIRH